MVQRKTTGQLTGDHRFSRRHQAHGDDHRTEEFSGRDGVDSCIQHPGLAFGNPGPFQGIVKGHAGTGLYRTPGSGRLSKLRSEQWKLFAEWVQKGAKSLGYRFVKWTTRSLRKYLFKRFNITFSREWIRQKLHQFLKDRWTRGKKVYASPENDERTAERTAFAHKMLTYLEQAHNGDIILLFEDESIFTLFGEVGYSWSPIGETQDVPSAGKRGRVVTFGAANPLARRLHYRIEDDSINQASSLRFLTQGGALLSEACPRDSCGACVG